jgi:chromate reductase, NAD(P)H dehydrogenase (quinone)
VKDKGVKILAVSGSLQAGSSNVALLQTAVRLAPAGVEVVIFDGLRELPHFNPDLEAEGPVPAVEAWRQAIASSDALLVACPEYGFSLPGVLKNGIDWAIGSGELERKAIAITASVTHPERGRRGLGALRDTLNAVSAQIVGGEPIARGPDLEQALKMLLDELAAIACRAADER